MITPSYLRTMSAYNAEMNRRTYDAAGRLADAERRADRGAFWGSIHGTLNHLIWADANWMSRLADRPKPDALLTESSGVLDDFAVMRERRTGIDEAISVWARTVTADWLAGDLTWYSGATKQVRTAPRTLIIMHMFNHQTHHRGQVHALLTRAGEDTGDTDLPFVLAQIGYTG